MASIPPKVQEAVDQFVAAAFPLEKPEHLYLLQDSKTDAWYCECHISAKTFVDLGTINVPLDPEEQSEYRANREIMGDHDAFQRMRGDARLGRTFSNIVAEFTTEFDSDHPVKIIGGQHRFEAIREALSAGVDKYHGVKLYMALTMEQRLDVQLISNTNIAVSSDLFDRMQETVRGPELRNWCQEVGLLEAGHDFADKRERGGRLPVQLARTFITNYYLGKRVKAESFAVTSTTPVLCPTGQHDGNWDVLLASENVWKDAKLKAAAKEFSLLVAAQRDAFSAKKPKPKPDYPEKAMNPAILSAWAYVAGMLHSNETRLRRHFALRDSKGKDPLNAHGLAKGRHKTDPENYRGLGYRTDQRERGRFVELFFNQAESGDGINSNGIDVAIKQYHAKQATLDVIKAKEK